MFESNIKLNQIATVIDCEHKTAPTVDEGIPLIRTPDIDRGRLKSHQARRVTEKTFAQWTRRAIPIPGDLIMAREAPVGNVGIVNRQERVCLGQRTVLIQPDRSKVCPEYLNYVFSTDALHAYMNMLATGATVGHLNVGDIRKLSLPEFPPIRTQQKIAATLIAYDDLIENNRQRIALLEKMAEEIYREWFVRLRFPGHEHTPVHKGVPEGWAEEPILDAFDFTGGGTPSKKENRFWDPEEVNWYTPSDITASNGFFLFESGVKCSEDGLRKSSARLFPAYSIMLTSRATIGAIGINTTPASTNQGFITCIPNDRYPLVLLYHWVKLAKPHFEMLSSGATFAELTKGTFKKIRILRPTDDLIERYESLARPNFDCIELLSRRNARLQTTRDLLLNRLISGKLRVDDLDIQFPPSMQPEAA